MDSNIGMSFFFPWLLSPLLHIKTHTLVFYYDMQVFIGPDLHFDFRIFYFSSAKSVNDRIFNDRLYS